MNSKEEPDQKSVIRLNKSQVIIAKATMKIFNEKNSFTVTAAEVADEAKYSKANIFNHLKNMKGLYHYVFLFYYAELKSFSYKNLVVKKPVKEKLEQIWFNRSIWGLKHPTEMKYLYIKMANYQIASLHSEDIYLNSIIEQGIAEQSLKKFPNPNYISSLFTAFNNSMIITTLNQIPFIAQKIKENQKLFDKYSEVQIQSGFNMFYWNVQNG